MQRQLGAAMIIAAAAIVLGFEAFWGIPLQTPNAQGQFSEPSGIVGEARLVVWLACTLLAVLGVALIVADPWNGRPRR
jgi:hypothetical protein